MMNKIIVANWKMNMSREKARDFIKNAPEKKFNKDIIICPPFPFICELYSVISQRKLNISVGGQDCGTHGNGAYTGDVSAQILSEYECKNVIIGHSERKKYHQETNEIIAKKIEIAIKYNLIPILCIGEALEEYENSRTNDILNDQISHVIENTEIQRKIIIAYEPRWAIGSGLTPTKKEISNAISHIKSHTSSPILYGGSVDEKNAKDILAISDGLLIGGASLDCTSFFNICIL